MGKLSSSPMTMPKPLTIRGKMYGLFKITDFQLHVEANAWVKRLFIVMFRKVEVSAVWQRQR